MGGMVEVDAIGSAGMAEVDATGEAEKAEVDIWYIGVNEKFKTRLSPGGELEVSSIS